MLGKILRVQVRFGEFGRAHVRYDQIYLVGEIS